MTAIQELKLRMIECRRKMPDALGDEYRALESEWNDLDERRVRLEGDESGHLSAAVFGDESAEFRTAVGDASVDRIIHAALRGHAIDGAEREIQQHYGLPANAIPLRMLIPEHRAAASFGADASTPGSTPGIAGQVFGDSAAGFLNVGVSDVPVGTRVVPVITTGALDNVGTPVGSATNAETDVVFDVVEMKPGRAQVSFAYKVEDAATYEGLDAGLRTNIRSGLRDKLDDVMLNGTDKGLLTTAHSAYPNAPAAVSTAAQYLAALQPDGRHAASENDVRLLVGGGANGIYQHMMGLAVADAGRLTTIMGQRLRLSPHVADYAGNRQDGLVIRGTTPNAQLAVWPGVEILEDRGSRAQEGEVRLYGVILQDFAILRTTGYVRHAFRTS